MQQVQFGLPRHLDLGSPRGRRLTIQERLGNGAFGVVYRVKEQGSSNVYALKDVQCENVPAIENALREVHTLSQVDHENVITIVGAHQFLDRHSYHVLILTEFCSGGNLNDRLDRPSTEDDNLKWMVQTAKALAYLHSCGIVHRDLKPDNVLLSDPITENVKVADFGLARQYIALKRTDVWLGDDSWLASYTQYYMNSDVGPIYWVAPEFFRRHYTEKADVFSLGAVCFAILERDCISVHGKRFYGAFVQFPGIGKVGLGFAMAKLVPDIEPRFSPGSQGSNPLRRIVLDALQYDSNDRPSAEEVLENIENLVLARQIRTAGDQPGCC